VAKNRGNLIQEYSGFSISRDFNYGNHENGNYIFNPEGIITSTYLNADFRYCQPSAGRSGDYIKKVSAATGPTFNPANVFATYSDNMNSTNGHRYFPYDVFRLKAGNTYTFRVELGIGGSDSIYTNYYGYLFNDINFNADFTGENVADNTSFNSSGYKDITFSVPANTPQGTTEMRIIALRSNTISGPCSSFSSNGEIEDYTLYISNPNYTITQYTGGAIPAQIASATVNADSAGQYVEQNTALSIKDSLVIQAGKFSPSNFALKLQGDFVNNAGIDALNSGTIGGIIFNGTTNQNIEELQIQNSLISLLKIQEIRIFLKKRLTVKNLMSFTRMLIRY